MATRHRPAALLHNQDAIELPDPATTVYGRAARDDSYPIHVAVSLDEALEQLSSVIAGRRVAAITDGTVATVHGELLERLVESGVEVEIATVPSGERHKTLRQACDLLDWLAGTQLTRRDLILAFGGGVVIDMGGWVASSYMRGVHYANIPTTLVAQVDAAIGGKVAVNHRLAKNMIGGFFQPSLVVSNIAFLTTLDRRHLRAGLAEAIKKAVIASPAYWRLIEAHSQEMLRGDPGALRELVHGAGAIKAELIARDPYELDPRRTLGFGHAIAHPVETVCSYTGILHGEAVAFGMVVEAHIAAARGLLPDETFDRIVCLLRDVGLPTTAGELSGPVDADRLVPALERVRLIRGGEYRFVLPIDLGETVIADDVAPEELHEALGRAGVPMPG